MWYLEYNYELIQYVIMDTYRVKYGCMGGCVGNHNSIYCVCGMFGLIWTGGRLRKVEV